MKNCKICSNEFVIPKQRGGSNQITCSDKCRKINQSLLKRESNLRLKDNRNNILKDYSNENKIPIYKIMDYGIEFLNNNPIVIEVIQMQTKLSGHFSFLTEEEKLIRRRATERQAREKFRATKIFKQKDCKICTKPFIPGVDVKSCRGVCCSTTCSKELHRIQSNEAGKRQRDKRKKNLLV